MGWLSENVNSNVHKLFCKEWLFLWELPALRQGIPPEEWNSARHYRLLNKESTKGMEFLEEFLAPGRGIHQKNGIPPRITSSGHGFRPARSKIFI
jgi:hypothetical protein